MKRIFLLIFTATCLCVMDGFAQQSSPADTVYHFNMVSDSLEFELLKELYVNTNGNSWYKNTNWLKGKTSKDFAKWHGVSVANGDVYAINLDNNNLTGVIPFSISYLGALQSISYSGNNVSEARRAKPKRVAGISPMLATTIEKNLPVWALGVTNNSKDINVDWKNSPVTSNDIPLGSSSGVSDGVAVAVDACGGIAFYARHTGSDQSYQLHLYAADGTRLTNNSLGSPLRALNSVAGNTEIQIVKVPGSSDEWYIIYSLYRKKCQGASGYCFATVVYAKVKYNTATKILTISPSARETQLGPSAAFIQGKAVSRKAGIDTTKHYLYLVKRYEGTNASNATMQLYKFQIDNSGITQVQTSFVFNARWWFLGAAGSSLELSPDENTLAISNRNESSSANNIGRYEDIILFDLTKFGTTTNNPVKINIPDLVVQPDNNVLKVERKLDLMYKSVNGTTLIPCFKYLRNKLSSIEFSPSGQYLYVTGGGFPKYPSAATGTHSTYLLQIDLWSSSGAGASDFDVRIQVQKGVGVGSNCQGDTPASAGVSYHPVGVLQTAFDGKLYFVKGNQNSLFVIPNPDAPMPQNFSPAEISLATTSAPNINLSGSSFVSVLPENIDGFDYMPAKTLPQAKFTLDRTVAGIGVTVNLTVSDYVAGRTYIVNWGDGTSENFTTASKSHIYASSNLFTVVLTATDMDGCSRADQTVISITPCQVPVDFILSHSSVKTNISFELTILKFTTLNTYLINWGNGSTEIATSASVSHSYPLASGYTITVTATSRYNGCSAAINKSITITQPDALCQTVIPISSTGTFKRDKFSGQIVYDLQDNCSPPLYIPCIEGKVESPVLNNVVRATAVTYSDNFSYAFSPVAIVTPQKYENGQLGRWKPLGSYSYIAPINYQANDKNYMAGRFVLNNFNWQYPDLSLKAGWIRTNQVLKYSADGDAVEEINELNMLSVAKFGYRGSVPYLIAQNAEYMSVMFESFENDYGNLLEDNVLLSGVRSATAHSGKYSLAISSSFSSNVMTGKNKPVQVRFWATGIQENVLPNGDVVAGNAQIESTSGSSGAVTRIARSGNWSLWESIIYVATGPFTIKLSKTGAGNDFLIDDFRIQPADAEMTCYVYDSRTLRVITIFDDQHFGLYYQYNDEGKLVRQQIETEKGLKTLKETQYNTPTKPKTP